MEDVSVMTVYSYGGGQVLSYIFNAVVTIFKGGAFTQVVKIAALLAGFWVIIMAATKNSLMIPIQWFIWFIICTQLVLFPKGDIHIYDVVTKDRYKVDNIPYVLGKFASLTSQVGHYMTSVMEEQFSLPDDLQYHKTGSVFGSDVMLQMGKAVIIDANFKREFDHFAVNCIAYDAMIGSAYTMEDLHTSDDIWTLIRGKTSNLRGFYMRDENGKNPKFQTCREGAGKLEEKFNKQVKKTAGYLNDSLVNSNKRAMNSLITNQFTNSLSNIYGFMNNTSSSGEALIKQQMMINGFKDAVYNAAGQGTSGYSFAKAILQHQNSMVTSGKLAGKMLPMIKSVFEGILYASFIFIGLLALIPSGYQLLLQYLTMMIWLQLWAPLYSVLNLIISVYGAYQTSSLIGEDNAASILTSAGLFTIHNNMVSAAGWLGTMIPFLAYMLMKGGVSSFAHIAGSMSSMGISAASHATNETISGNISQGNVSYSNHSMLNSSGYKTNMSFNQSSNSISQEHIDGSISRLTGDGSQIVMAGKGYTTSTLPDDVNLRSNFNKQLSSNLSNEQSHLSSLNNEIAQTASQAIRTTTAMSERISKDGLSSIGYSKSLSDDQVQAINTTMNFQKDIQDRFGLSSAQAAELSAGMSGSYSQGMPIMAGILSISGNGSANFKSHADYQEAITKVQNYAEQKGVSNNISQGIRTMEDMSIRESLGNNSSLTADNISSFDKIDQLRASKTESEQTIERLQSAITYSENHSTDINQNYTQEVLEWVSKQSGYGSNGPMGMGAAKFLALHDRELFRSYVNQYVNGHLNEYIDHANSSNSHTKSAASIMEPEKINATSYNEGLNALEGKHTKFNRTLESKASTEGLKSIDTRLNVGDKVGPDHIKATVQASSLDNQRTLNKHKQELEDRQNILNDNYSKESNEYTLQRATTGIFKDTKD